MEQITRQYTLTLVRSGRVSHPDDDLYKVTAYLYTDGWLSEVLIIDGCYEPGRVIGRGLEMSYDRAVEAACRSSRGKFIPSEIYEALDLAQFETIFQ